MRGREKKENREVLANLVKITSHNKSIQLSERQHKPRLSQIWVKNRKS